MGGEPEATGTDFRVTGDDIIPPAAHSDDTSAAPGSLTGLDAHRFY